MKAIQRFLPFKPLKQFFQESCGRSQGAAGELPAPRSPLGIPEADFAQSEGSAGITTHQHQGPGQEMQALPLITSSLLLLGALCEERASQCLLSKHSPAAEQREGWQIPRLAWEAHQSMDHWAALLPSTFWEVFSCSLDVWAFPRKAQNPLLSAPNLLQFV